MRFPFPIEGPDMVRHLAALMESGQFRPLLDRTYRLEDIADAYRYVETGRKAGNVIIEIVPEQDHTG